MLVVKSGHDHGTRPSLTCAHLPGGIVRYVVLTGGPCAGKSTVLGTLAEQLGDQVVVATEAATEVLASTGPPQANWGNGQWTRLQQAITKLMAEKEAELESRAQLTGARVGILDRAPDDNRAYPEGAAVVDYFRRHKSLRPLGGYHLVIHLQSLAVSQPQRYSELVRSNPFRYESLEEAQAQNERTLEAWSKHPLRVVLSNDGSVEDTVHQCVQLIKALTI
jgi:predicted ATPase